MDKQNSNLHNDFFKVSFSRQDVVEGYIKQFLNKNLVKNIDLQTLTLSDTSYVTGKLAEYASDIVWESKYGAAETPIKIAFLFEHKSFVPKFPHIQLLRYMLEIWEECEENSKPLTPIIPIIVYHNKENRHWHYKPFSDYFKDIDPFLLPYIPKFDYELTDLTALTPEQWAAMQMTLLLHALQTLQFGTNKEYVLENVKTLFVSLKNDPSDDHLRTFLLAQLVYVLKSSDFGPEKVKSIINEVKNTTGMNSYDYLMDEAKKEGIDLGVTKGKREVIKNILVECPQWSDEKIANLAASTVEVVKSIRAELKK